MKTAREISCGIHQCKNNPRVLECSDECDLTTLALSLTRREGAEDMRERAAQTVHGRLTLNGRDLSEFIRALPVTE